MPLTLPFQRLTSSAFSAQASSLLHMSNTQSTAFSSSNFQLIVNNALKAYERRTKKDLIAHPLFVQLQDCNSPSAILDVLQQQAQELDQFQSTDDRCSKWLDPTVNVLYALSATLGEGVGLVRLLRTQTGVRCALLYLFCRCSHLRRQSLLGSESSFWCAFSSLVSLRPSSHS
jgi:hypothetical protein